MPYQISINNQDLSFTCEPDQTILDAAISHNVMLSYGCRDGLCGSCKGRVIEGQIEYPHGTPAGISDSEIEDGEALFCQAVPSSDLRIEARTLQRETEIIVKTLPCKVKALDHLSDDVIRLTLQLPAMERFDFKAGQWIYVLLKDGRKRAFSLANAPSDKADLELHIRHAVGGVFTDFVFKQLAQGNLLRIEGPHGTFWYQPDQRPILLVAGGTGFAPIKGIFEEISKLEQRPPVHLFWGVRGQQDLYMADLVQRWVDEYAIDYTPVLSQPEPDAAWSGATGLVHEAVLETYPDMSAHAVYMAGPPQMIESCRQGFIAAGLDENCLYYDAFEYSSDALKAMQEKS